MKKYTEDLRPKLEKLPIPDLHETLDALIEWTKPLMTNEELSKFQEKVTTFGDSEGILLQKELMQYTEQRKGSWLAPLWQEGYLESRGYLQSESNFALIIDQDFYKKIKTREARAAQLIYHLTKIYLSLANETYPIEYTRNNQNVDMSFYPNFFKSCRIPGRKIDSFYKGEQGTANLFVVLIVSGVFFRLNVTDDKGNVYPIQQLLENLHYILSLEIEPKQQENLLPYLTSVGREESALIYQQLKKSKENLSNLMQIENALFILSFSQGEDHTANERINDVLLNTSHQFLAKTTQVILTKNGYIGFNLEHTAIDGVPTLNMLTELFASFTDQDWIVQDYSSSLVEKFEWVLENDSVALLEKAKKVAEVENNSYSIKHQVIAGIGKERMKKGKVSPDAFFHIALAMAQQTVFGKLRSVYEPVAMRMFYEGRTESARSISQEKRDFAEAFYEQKETVSKKELVELFNKAATAHSNRISQCQKGKGIERHLLGYKKELFRRT
ncbi:hypothetical protein A5880_002654 [Enterococcus sp. 4G2_DIV0659]|uniref:Choline/carnitine acyltransferase domain-containing protein n=1 Tax=Candidatus Enterococcus mansonii TaxID=1834181 RepID=A0ABU8IHW3_9ENTE